MRSLFACAALCCFFLHSIFTFRFLSLVRCRLLFLLWQIFRVCRCGCRHSNSSCSSSGETDDFHTLDVSHSTIVRLLTARCIPFGARCSAFVKSRKVANICLPSLLLSPFSGEFWCQCMNNILDMCDFNVCTVTARSILWHVKVFVVFCFLSRTIEFNEFDSVERETPQTGGHLNTFQFIWTIVRSK